MAELRPTDLLPPHFDGETLNRELATSWFLSFQDYLIAHGLQAPADDAALANVIQIFKCRLSRQARLWAEDQVFHTIDALKAAFLARFSPTYSDFANVRIFEAITYTAPDTAHQHLSKVRLAATRINYGVPQIRNKFLQTLPTDCQRAVIMASGPNTPVNDLADLAQRFLDISPHVHFGAADQIHSTTQAAATANSVMLDTIIQKLDSIHVAQQPSHVSNSQAQNRSTSPARSGSPHPHRGRDSRHTQRRDDHHRRRSQSPSRPRSGDRDRPPCHFCGRRNHFWRYCYKFQQQVALGNLPPDFIPPAARNRPQNGNSYGPQSYSQQPPNYSWQRDNYRPSYYDQPPPNHRQDL